MAFTKYGAKGITLAPIPNDFLNYKMENTPNIQNPTGFKKWLEKAWKEKDQKLHNEYEQFKQTQTPPTPPKKRVEPQEEEPEKIDIEEENQEEQEQEREVMQPLPQPQKKLDIETVQNQAYTFNKTVLSQDDPLLFFLSQQLQITNAYHGTTQELRKIQKEQENNAEKILAISNQFSINLNSAIQKIDTNFVVKQFSDLFDLTITNIKKNGNELEQVLNKTNLELIKTARRNAKLLNQIEEKTQEINSNIDGLNFKLIAISFCVGVIVTSALFAIFGKLV